MSHKIAGTNFDAENIGTWLRFELAVERQELKLHKERCLPETARKIREQAAQAVIDSGLFYTAPSAGVTAPSEVEGK